MVFGLSVSQRPDFTALLHLITAPTWTLTCGVELRIRPALALRLKSSWRRAQASGENQTLTGGQRSVSAHRSDYFCFSALVTVTSACHTNNTPGLFLGFWLRRTTEQPVCLSESKYSSDVVQGAWSSHFLSQISCCRGSCLTWKFYRWVPIKTNGNVMATVGHVTPAWSLSSVCDVAGGWEVIWVEAFLQTGARDAICSRGS